MHNPMIKDYIRTRDDAPDMPNAGPAEVFSTPPGSLSEAQRTPPEGSAPAADGETPTYTRAADTRDAALVHKAFQGDTSLLAGAGKGIQSVPEYRRS